MSRCDLELSPVDLESSRYIKRHVVKVCTEFERNSAIPGELLIILRSVGLCGMGLACTWHVCLTS